MHQVIDILIDFVENLSKAIALISEKLTFIF